jgi:hypothetical protein
MQRRAGAVVVGVMAWAGAAAGHHSFAQFDYARTERLSGTVRAVDWADPHPSLWIEVPGPGATAGRWQGLFSGTEIMLEKGLTRDTLRPGDKIEVAVHPNRDGARSGWVIMLVRNGATLFKSGSFGLPTR